MNPEESLTEIFESLLKLIVLFKCCSTLTLSNEDIVIRLIPKFDFKSLLSLRGNPFTDDLKVYLVDYPGPRERVITIFYLPLGLFRSLSQTPVKSLFVITSFSVFYKV